MRGLAIEFGEKCMEIFGHPVKVYADKDEYIMFTRVCGKNARFDLEASNLEGLLAQLPEQIMDWTEMNMQGGSPWFSIDRDSTKGIATHDKKIRSFVMVDDDYIELKVTDQE